MAVVTVVFAEMSEIADLVPLWRNVEGKLVISHHSSVFSGDRVTICLNNLEMSVNLMAVAEM